MSDTATSLSEPPAAATSSGETETSPPSPSSTEVEVSKIDVNQIFDQSYEMKEKTIKTLSGEHFELDKPNLIELKKKECFVILFYIQNSESIFLCDIFSKCASMIRGPKLGAVNMMREKSLSEAFVKIGDEQAHPFHWAKLKGYPFIIVYRNGRPTSFYNGERSVPALSDYILTLACNSSYFEPFNMYGGVQYDNNSVSYRAPNIYFNDQTHQMRSSSEQYTGYPGNALRYGQNNDAELKKNLEGTPSIKTP